MVRVQPGRGTGRSFISTAQHRSQLRLGYGWEMSKATTVKGTVVQYAVLFSGALVLVVVVSLGIFVWRTGEGIRNPEVDQLHQNADAVVVFAGEDARFTLGRELVESGVAQVLVLNASDLPDVASEWCVEQTDGFDIVCVVPSTDGTLGEGQAYGRLATERGWSSVVGVTGDYHVQRARLVLTQCFAGEVAMAQLGWGSPSVALIRKEAAGFIHSKVVRRAC